MQVQRKGGRPWRRLRAHVLDQEPLCRLCMAKGRVTAATEVDHIIPLHKGGLEFEASNLRPVCAECHQDVTNETMGHRVKRPVGLDGWPID